MHRIARLTVAALAFVSIAVIGSTQAASASESANVSLQHVPTSVGMVGAQMPEPDAPQSNDAARLFVSVGAGMIVIGSVIVVRALSQRSDTDAPAVKASLIIAM